MKAFQLKFEDLDLFKDIKIEAIISGVSMNQFIIDIIIEKMKGLQNGK